MKLLEETRDAEAEVLRLRAEVSDLKQRLADSQSLESARAVAAKSADSERLLRRFVQHMPVMLEALDERGNYIVWNHECERVTGYQAADIVRQPHANRLLYPNKGHRTRLFTEWRKRGNDYRNWEWSLTCKDGTRKTIAWTDVSGSIRVPGWAVWRIGVDVTQLRQLELDVERSQRILETVVQSSPDVLFMKDLEGVIVLANEAAAAVVGRQPADLTGKCNADLLSSKLAKQLDKQDRKVLRTGQAQTFEDVFPGPNGPRIFQTTKAPCRAKDGNLLGVVGVAREVTELKQAQEALRRYSEELEQRVEERTRELSDSEERFRTIAELVPMPIAIATWEPKPKDSRIVYGNPALLHQLRRRQEEFVGKLTLPFYHDPQDADNLWKMLSEDGSVRNYELQAPRGDGTLTWLSVSLERVPFQGRSCVLGAVIDISEHKRREGVLETERQVQKRLLDWHERDRKLVAYEIHDGIVQDLTGAAMFLEAFQYARAEATAGNEEFATGVGLLRGGIDEARRLINGLKPPLMEELGVIAAVENLIQEIRTLKKLDVRLVQRVTFSRLAPVMEVAIFRIVQESLNNIWKHSQSQKALVEITEKAGRLRITVEDWGCGFNLKKVKPGRHGLTGIRQRAELLDGKAEIRSSVGKGTLIQVDLPLNGAVFPQPSS